MNTVVESAPQTDPVDALIKSIRIPPRPSLLADLQRELAADDPSPDAIGRIVASDVGMSGALLKLANSSVYGGRRKAKSIEQAILFLGINQVAALMTGLLARQAIPVNSAALASFWDISTRRAHAMVFLSRRLRIGEPDVAHTFGLFCDTGVPLLMDRFPDYDATYGAASMEPHRPFTDARRRTPQHQPRRHRLPAGAQLGPVDRRLLGHPAPPRLRRARRRRHRRRRCARWSPCRCWPRARSAATRATPSRSNGTRAARAPAPIWACPTKKPPKSWTNCSRPFHEE